MAYVLSNGLATFTFADDATTGLKLYSFRREGSSQTWLNYTTSLWSAEVYDTTTAPTTTVSTITPTLATFGGSGVATDADGQYITAAWTNVPVGTDRLSVSLELRLNTGEDWLRVTVTGCSWSIATKYALHSLGCLALQVDPLNQGQDFAVVPNV